MCGGSQEMEGDLDVGYDFVRPDDDEMGCGRYIPECTGDDTWLLSLEPDSPGDPGKETKSYLTGCGDPVTGIVFANGPDGTSN